MDGVILTPLKKMPHPKGEISHAIKAGDPGFVGFGEAYFTEIIQGETKGWKKHSRMTLNLIVAIGAVEFVVLNEESGERSSIVVSTSNYSRLTVSAGLWVAFTGLEPKNIILNIANICHDPSEAVNLGLDAFD